MKILVLIFFICCCAHPMLSQKRVFTIHAGATDRENVPVRVLLPVKLNQSRSYEVINQKNNKATPAQVVNDGNELVFIIQDPIKPNSSARYLLKPSKNRQKNTIHFEEQQGSITAKTIDRSIFTYHAETVMPPADSPEYYKRSGFIHPLYSPGGEILTDDFPAGHAHQHALFAAWTNTTFKKSFVDFWNQQQQKGTVEHVSIVSMKDGPVCGTLELLLRYRSWQFGEVLQERWKITVYNTREHFLFDIDLEQINTSSDTLYLNKYHYGGMAFRGSKFWNPDDKKFFRNNWKILTSEGIRDSAANHTKARWVDASGQLGSNIAGVTVFGHPANFRYPQPIRVHPQMPYWVFAPMVEAPFSIDPGKKYRARFRYCVHEGRPDVGMLQRLHQDYAEPVVVMLN